MHSSPRWRRALVGSVAAAALVATVFAGSSSALVTETDVVNLDGDGVDFGGLGFGLPDTTPNQALRLAPSNAATISWDEAWFAVVPKLHGYIKFDNFGTNCARIRLQSYDSDDVEIGDETSSPEACSQDNSPSNHLVDMSGAPGARSVTVTLESLNALGDWAGVVDPVSVDYGPEIDSDAVKIARANFDVGEGAFVGGNPAEAATLTWIAGVSGPEAHLHGLLYINDTGLCARVKLKVLDSAGTVIETKEGGTVCGVENELKKYRITDLTTPGNHSAAEVKVVLESFGGPPPGAWSTEGSTTVALN